MNTFEDPFQFKIIKKFGSVTISYSDCMEISQGGPISGILSINGKKLNGRYGGPAICQDGYLYVPSLVKKFFGTGFKLAKIDIDSLMVEYLSKSKDLIFIDRIEGNKIFFLKIWIGI